MAIDKVGQSISKGFYVPSSQSSSYVASKRNDEGSYEYTSQAQDIGLQRKAALQDLSEQYGDVVENAYASYLANQRTINASAMGQGYKDAYEQMQQQNLVNQVAQAGLSAANARQQLDESALKAREQLDEQFALETTNLDKVGTQLDNYFEYLKGLSNEAGQNYLEAMGIKYDENTRAQDIYNELYNAAPYAFVEGGQTFFDYVNANIGDKKADTDWRDWLFYNKGWDEYVDALNKSKNEPAYITKRNEELETERKEISKLMSKTYKDYIKSLDVALKAGKIAQEDYEKITKIAEEKAMAEAGIGNQNIGKGTINKDKVTFNNTEYTLDKNNKLDSKVLTRLYDYFKNINKTLQVGDVITIGDKQYIYTDSFGKQNKGLYLLDKNYKGPTGYKVSTSMLL